MHPSKQHDVERFLEPYAGALEHFECSHGVLSIQHHIDCLLHISSASMCAPVHAVGAGRLSQPRALTFIPVPSTHTSHKNSSTAPGVHQILAAEGEGARHLHGTHAERSGHHGANAKQKATPMQQSNMWKPSTRTQHRPGDEENNGHETSSNSSDGDGTVGGGAGNKAK